MDLLGLEPKTIRLWAGSSNQLSYRSIPLFNYSVFNYELFAESPDFTFILLDLKVLNMYNMYKCNSALQILSLSALNLCVCMRRPVRSKVCHHRLHDWMGLLFCFHDVSIERLFCFVNRMHEHLFVILYQLRN